MQAISILLAAALHECGHIAAMCLTGRPPESLRVCLFGVVITRRPGVSPHFCDLAVYMAGCAANLVCAGLFYRVAPEFARVSAALCVFNLLPLDGFDGCCALSSLLSAAFSRGTVENCTRIISAATLAILWAAVLYVNLYTGRGFYPLAMCVYLTAPKIVAAAKKGGSVTF